MHMLESFKGLKRIHLILGTAILLALPCYCLGIVVYINNEVVDQIPQGTEDQLPTEFTDETFFPTFTFPGILGTETLTPTITSTFTATITYVLPATDTPTPSLTPTITDTATSTPTPTQTYTLTPSDTATETLAPSPTDTYTPIPTDPP